MGNVRPASCLKPSSFKGLLFLSCMLWHVLVRSQIKFDTYWVEYLSRKCTEANQEQSFKNKTKPKHPANILNFWQTNWTAWIPRLGVINSGSFCHILGSYIFIYPTACVRLSRLDGFLKNVLPWKRAGQPGCHVVIWVAQAASGAAGTLPSALPEPRRSHELHNSSNSQLFMTILIAQLSIRRLCLHAAQQNGSMNHSHGNLWSNRPAN